MKKPSGRKVILFLIASAAVVSSLVYASINPAETSPACMPDYMKKHGSAACVATAKSKDTSIEVIGPNPH